MNEEKSVNKKPLLVGMIALAVLHVVVLLTIFNFSAQTGEISAGLSDRIVTFLTGLEKTAENMAEFSRVSYMVRKAAHVTVFFSCGFTLFWLLVLFCQFIGKFKLRYVSLITLAGSFLMACLDEFHQSFVGGRGPAFTDVLIDSIGITGAVLLGNVLFLFFKWLINKRKTHTTGKEDNHE